MENMRKEDSSTIKVEYMYKGKYYSFILEESNLKLFEQNCYITKGELFYISNPEIDKEIKQLAEEHLKLQTDYLHDGHPMNIFVYRDGKHVYFIPDYYSEEEKQNFISKILCEK